MRLTIALSKSTLAAGGVSVASRTPRYPPLNFLPYEYSAYLSRLERADERTLTADLSSLRVCGQQLLSVAEVCKFGISKGFSVPCIAHYCTVLHPG
jgi:hypothetical protein